MGKMKWYAVPEDNIQQRTSSSVTTTKTGFKSKPAVKHLHQQPDIPTLYQLFRQIMMRFRRNWIAFRFQFNRYTLGMFKKQTALKMGALAACTYLLFFSNGLSFLSDQTGYSESVSIGPVETAIEVVDKPKGRSLLVRTEPKGTAVKRKSIAPQSKETNDTAPLGAHQMRSGSTENYIARYSKIAIQEMKRYGIPASISLAQGLVESRYGTSTLAVRNNNHFGMKCFSKNCRPGHCSNHNDDHHKDFFRKYNNAWESWRAHSIMLANGRYGKLKKYGRNYRDWARGLERLGYATDPSYSEKLIGVIERYKLHRFDR